ncbi:MAG: pirin family protein [Youngiibacter sp.]|nr:pirin family protein [Youngiibacter sp.]
MAGKIIETGKLGFVWTTDDPFLFCVHHRDDYPSGNNEQGPAASLDGRDMGRDFDASLPWRMYHGETAPGFPVHPHRGFETVTIVLEGFVDHSDSSGASGRYGQGDVQWMTAGSGMQHSEMFPLVFGDRGNPLELFQIWLNLPKKSKLCNPHYKMLWNEDIPVKESNGVRVKVIAGSFDGAIAVAPPPDSWAGNPDKCVKILLLDMDEGSEASLPPGSASLNRSIYFFSGTSIDVDGTKIKSGHRIKLNGSERTNIIACSGECRLLVLEGEPIGEPVAAQGPFVMNTREEIMEAYREYRKTEFGGWPWESEGPVHNRTSGRFALYADGTSEYKDVEKI